MPRLPFSAALGIAALAVAVPALAQLTPEESLKAMRTGDGLEVTLFAAEPDLVNPTMIDVDARGRVWVAEAANYRIFKNPVRRPEGDRIRILEDTDGDGKCDKATTFYQDPSLQAPIGICVLGSRVYVCQSPDLFYLEDTDGDGVADKKTVILTGFGGKDHDHAVHGVMYGPDGHLYLSVGDEGLDVTDKHGNRVYVRKKADAPHVAGSVLRTDLEGEHLELLCEGLRNPYQPTVDSFGNVFISDNDDDGNEQCRIVWVMEGGNYGYWPFRPGDRHLDAVHWGEDKPGIVPKILRTGFGSPTGMIFYEGSLLPERLRRALIHADAGPGVIRCYRVSPEGAGFKAEQESLLSCPGDKWFRPSAVSVAPDGSIFVADWYDPGVGGHNAGDWTRGRIYRLSVPGWAYKAPFECEKASAISLLNSPNQAARFLGRERLARATDAASLEALKKLAASPDPVQRARAIWAMAAKGRAGLDGAMQAGLDRAPEFRQLALRILAATSEDDLRQAQFMIDDRDAGVRRELLLRLQHATQPWAKDAELALAMAFNGRDRYYREAIGIAARGHEADSFRRFLQKAGTKWNKRLAEIAFELHPPEALDLAAARLAAPDASDDDRMDALRIVAAVGGEKAAETLVAQLDLAKPRPVALAAMESISRDEGRSFPKLAQDAKALEFMKAGLAEKSLRAPALKMIRALRAADRLGDVAAIAGDAAQSEEDRLAALETIQALKSPAALETLKGLLGDANPKISVAAARAIGSESKGEAQKALLALLGDASKPKEARKEAVRLLAAGRSGALALVQLADEGKLPADLRLDASTATNASPFDDVRMLASQILPLEQAKDGKALPPIAELVKSKGDAASGKKTFFAEDGPQCFKCHRIEGQGREVGPDLSKIGEKSAREALFESILNPSAAIAHEYQVWLVETRKDGYLSGYIRKESPEEIELMDAAGEPKRIAAKDILERSKSSASLMPTGLASGMTAGQLVDLVEFLSTLK